MNGKWALKSLGSIICIYAALSGTAGAQITAPKPIREYHPPTPVKPDGLTEFRWSFSTASSEGAITSFHISGPGLLKPIDLVPGIDLPNGWTFTMVDGSYNWDAGTAFVPASVEFDLYWVGDKLSTLKGADYSYDVHNIYHSFDATTDTKTSFEYFVPSNADGVVPVPESDSFALGMGAVLATCILYSRRRLAFMCVWPGAS